MVAGFMYVAYVISTPESLQPVPRPKETEARATGLKCHFSHGCGSILNRRGKPQVLVHVSTSQVPFWYRFFEPLPHLFFH